MPNATTGPENGLRQRLLRAGERLFASQGIDSVRLRELNALAGTRNPSAVHYYFGSREGLVQAILARHLVDVEQAIGVQLDLLEQHGDVTVRTILSSVVHPLVDKLHSEAGRDYLRIMPQLTPRISGHLRAGDMGPSRPQGRRALELLALQLGSLPEAVQLERLVAYVLAITVLLAERARVVELGEPLVLDEAGFEANLVDMLTGALTAPVSVS